jgi:hypothetical protein
MKHCQIDLETLGTQPGSVILSIGAVLFDPALPPDRCMGEQFYCVINRQSCVNAGLTVDPDTLTWWEKQSAGARQVLLDAENPEVSDTLEDALKMFAAFLPEGVKVWSNGANFDQPLLDVAYNRMGIALPWKYYNSRCYRTVVNLHPDEKRLRPINVLAHNALEDAKWQTKHLVNIAQLLGLKL